MIRIGVMLSLAVMAACAAPDDRPASNADVRGAEETHVPLTATQQRVVKAIEQIDAMRSGLAVSIGGNEQVDAETFARVCKPVGMRLKQTAEENGWLMRQLAVKYRNPAHAPDPEAAALFPRFEADAGLDSLWLRSEHEDTPGWRYLRRITIERACLACHGAQEARPDFVKANYPEDRAFGFQPGDLRGFYSVFVPDTLALNYY